MFGLSKLAIYLIIALFSLGAVTTTYYVWKRNIQHQALLEFNRQQMEQTQKDQAELMRRQQEIADQQAEAARALVERNEELNRRMSDVDRYLTSGQAQDRPASDVLKQTIERLRSGASR
jgi:Flp pilus assembly protein TadB